MVALQIAREPLVRQVLRQTFQERAKINISPTKKGKKVRKGALTLRVSLGRDVFNVQMLVLCLKTSPMSEATWSEAACELGCCRGKLSSKLHFQSQHFIRTDSCC